MVLGQLTVKNITAMNKEQECSLYNYLVKKEIDLCRISVFELFNGVNDIVTDIDSVINCEPILPYPISIAPQKYIGTRYNGSKVRRLDLYFNKTVIIYDEGELELEWSYMNIDNPYADSILSDLSNNGWVRGLDVSKY